MAVISYCGRRRCSSSGWGGSQPEEDGWVEDMAKGCEFSAKLASRKIE